MSKIHPYVGRSGQPFTRGVLLPVLLVALATIALGTFSILWAVNKSNDISAERQLRTTDRSIRAVVQELAQQQEMVAVWDDAVLELHKNPLDLKWLDANLGIWLSRTFDQDEVYILNERDQVVNATIDAARVATDEYERVREKIADLVAGLRGASGSVHREHVSDLADADYLTTGKAIHDAHLLELLGRPAAVSVMKIIPETEEVSHVAGKEFLLVSIRFLELFGVERNRGI